jgi:hypothetical protein
MKENIALIGGEEVGMLLWLHISHGAFLLWREKVSSAD